jgi:hypothetical protein
MRFEVFVAPNEAPPVVVCPQEFRAAFLEWRSGLDSAVRAGPLTADLQGGNTYPLLYPEQLGMGEHGHLTMHPVDLDVLVRWARLTRLRESSFCLVQGGPVSRPWRLKSLKGRTFSLSARLEWL